MWNEVIERYPGLSGHVFSSYVSLWARLPEIRLDDIVDSFEETGELIRVPAMRNAVIACTPEVYNRIYPAFKVNLERGFAAHLRNHGVDEGLLRIAADEILGVLGTDDLTASEIAQRLVRLKDLKPNVLNGILSALSAERVLVRARVHGGVSNSRFSYAAWEHWVPAVPRTNSDFRSAISDLAAWYFDAYPNAAVEDFRAWGGWDEIQLHRLEQELQYSRLVSTARPLSDEWIGWQILPPLDALTMAYRPPRAWIDPGMAEWVVDSAGNTTSVILENGRCAGIWDLVQVEDVLHEMRVAFFDPARKISFDLEQVFAALGKFLQVELANAVQVRLDRPLKQAGPSAYRSPLRDAVLE